MKAIDLVSDALATYRLTKLVIDDEITSDIRDAIWEKFPPAETKVGYLFTCPWCVSIWVGFGVAVARRVAPDAWSVASAALASSAATGIIEERS